MQKQRSNVENQQNLFDKRLNAMLRKNETEDMRRYINSIKDDIKNETNKLANTQKEMADIRARLEKTTDALEKGELTVELKLREIDETESKARLTEGNKLLTEEQTQFAVRQEEMAFQEQIDKLNDQYNTYMSSINGTYTKLD